MPHDTNSHTIPPETDASDALVDDMRTLWQRVVGHGRALGQGLREFKDSVSHEAQPPPVDSTRERST